MISATPNRPVVRLKRSWLDDVHPDDQLEARLRRELYEIDRELLPYMHPKLSAQRVDLEVRERTLADYLREGADG